MPLHQDDRNCNDDTQRRVSRPSPPRLGDGPNYNDLTLREDLRLHLLTEGETSPEHAQRIIQSLGGKTQQTLSDSDLALLTSLLPQINSQLASGNERFIEKKERLSVSTKAGRALLPGESLSISVGLFRPVGAGKRSVESSLPEQVELVLKGDGGDEIVGRLGTPKTGLSEVYVFSDIRPGQIYHLQLRDGRTPHG